MYVTIINEKGHEFESSQAGGDIWEGLEGRGEGENCVIILYYVLKK